MRHGLLIAIAAAVCLGPVWAQAADNPKSDLSRSLREDAQTAFQAKDLPQAEAYLRQSLTLDPDSDLTRAKLAIALLGQRRTTEAVAVISEVEFVWESGPEADYIDESISLVAQFAANWEEGRSDPAGHGNPSPASGTDWLSPLAPELARMARAAPIRRDRTEDCFDQVRLARLLERGGHPFKLNPLCKASSSDNLYENYHTDWLSSVGRPDEAIVALDRLNPSDDRGYCMRAPGSAASDLAGYSPALVERARKAARATCRAPGERALQEAAERGAHREFLKLAWAQAALPPWSATSDQDRARVALNTAYRYGDVRVIRSLLLAKGLSWRDSEYDYFAIGGLLEAAQTMRSRSRASEPAYLAAAGRMLSAEKDMARRIVVEQRPLGGLADWPTIPELERGPLQKLDSFIREAIRQFGLPETYRPAELRVPSP